MHRNSSLPWRELSALIAEATGLHFPSSRWPDLQRGLTDAARELRLDGLAELVSGLLSKNLNREQLLILTGHLTIGETYFWRDAGTFDVLSWNVLPELIRARRDGGKRLRLWSAGCCTGEEPYSLAILLHRLIPDIADWDVSVLATDISTRFLKKAAAGVYGKWSFRGVPPGFKEQFFEMREGGRYSVLPEIKKLVTFARLNLAGDLHLSGMDLILCRNVLMYFTPDHARRTVDKLHRALSQGGWLAVSPSETSQALFSQFVTVNFPDVILYRKEAQVEPHLPPIEPNKTAQPDARGFHLVAQPEFLTPQEETLPDITVDEDKFEPQECAQHARSLANQRRLAEALIWCNRWIAASKLDATAYFLHAVILVELGEPAEARRSFERAIYLTPDFVMAHYMLGSIALSGGKVGEAERHFKNTLNLLARHEQDDVLPESDGLTAGRLAETVAAMVAS